MKQSREVYEGLTEDVAQVEKAGEVISRAIRYFRSRGEENSAQYMELNEMHRIGMLGAVERRLHKYMKQGQGEANELNSTYDRLVQAVDAAESDLLEFSERCGGGFDEQAPEFTKIASKINKAIEELQAFKIHKLGMSDETETPKTNNAA